MIALLPLESSYMEGYKEGLNVGVFIAIVKHTRDVTTRPWICWFMTFESFKDLDEVTRIT